jgi:hypothetical protein
MLVSVAAGVAVFLVVQDRVTAAGVRRYVDPYRAGANIPPSHTLDSIMRPAVAQSVRLATLWGGGVMLAVFGIGYAMSSGRPAPPKGSGSGPVAPERSEGG